ncbi:MAG TPA: hypothetical protein VMJ64_11830 [Anaerolineales bacterium]|nr:hypothetical protein [Anaerolineales bacterium]
MQSISRGWLFLKEAWQMAFKDKDLIQPSIFAVIVGFIVSVAGLIPLIGAALLFGDSGPVGRAIFFIIGAILVFVQYVVGYVFSGMTVYLIYGYLAEGDGRMDKAWSKVQREFWNIISLAAVSALINVLTREARNNRNRRSPVGAFGGLIAGLLQSVWTEASYLILPAMMIEDANLVNGVKRATQIIKDNLLLIGVSTVGVKWVTGAISFVLGLAGLVIGVAVGGGLIAVLGTSTAPLVVGVALGALIFFAFVMVASVISSYTMTAYNTCLFLWARDVEKARAESANSAIPVQLPAPAPLAAVFS